MLVGKEFHNLGPAIVNERSPNVWYHLHTGVLSKRSLVDRKLYLDYHFAAEQRLPF